MATSQPTPVPADRTQPQTTPPNADRSSDGKFAPGNKLGKGNPFARQCAELRKALLNAVTPQNIAEIAAKLLEKAKAGDAAAARVLFSYTLGQPAAPVDPDTINKQELQTMAANRVDVEAAQRCFQVPAADFMLHVLYEMMPFTDRKMAQEMCDRLMPSPEELQAYRQKKQKEESHGAGKPGASANHAARDGTQGAAAGGGRQDEFGAAQHLQLRGGIAGLESSLREGPRKSSGNADEARGLFDPHAR
jgi:hypothetical protein